MFHINRFEPKIIVASQAKGGVGKTTVALHLAFGLARKDLRVALADADAQAQATAWVAAAPADKKPPFDVYSVSSARRSLTSQLEQMARNFDAVIVDSPPGHEDPSSLAAMLAGNLVISPMRASPCDLRAAADTVELVRQARKVNPSLEHKVLPTMLRGTKVALEVLSVAAQAGLPLLASRLGDRTAYQLAAALGTSVHSLGFAHRRAALEVDELVDEVYDLLWKGFL